jgi:hypothetical protein
LTPNAQRIMNRFIPFALLVGVLALPACDFFGGAEDDRPHAEIIIGTWDASTVNVLVDVGPVTVPVPVSDLAADEQSFEFGGDGSFRFTFDPDDDRRITIAYEDETYVDVPLPDGPIAIEGDYEVRQTEGVVFFSTVDGQTGDDFVMEYDLSNDRAGLELVAEDPRILGLLFGLAGEDYQVFAQYVVGGSIDYDRRQL